MGKAALLRSPGVDHDFSKGTLFLISTHQDRPTIAQIRFESSGLANADAVKDLAKSNPEVRPFSAWAVRPPEKRLPDISKQRLCSVGPWQSPLSSRDSIAAASVRLLDENRSYAVRDGRRETGFAAVSVAAPKQRADLAVIVNGDVQVHAGRQQACVPSGGANFC
jgi:hypothetical protein